MRPALLVLAAVLTAGAAIVGFHIAAGDPGITHTTKENRS